MAITRRAAGRTATRRTTTDTAIADTKGGIALVNKLLGDFANKRGELEDILLVQDGDNAESIQQKRKLAQAIKDDKKTMSALAKKGVQGLNLMAGVVELSLQQDAPQQVEAVATATLADTNPFAAGAVADDQNRFSVSAQSTPSSTRRPSKNPFEIEGAEVRETDVDTDDTTSTTSSVYAVAASQQAEQDPIYAEVPASKDRQKPAPALPPRLHETAAAELTAAIRTSEEYNREQAKLIVAGKSVTTKKDDEAIAIRVRDALNAVHTIHSTTPETHILSYIAPEDLHNLNNVHALEGVGGQALKKQVQADYAAYTAQEQAQAQMATAAQETDTDIAAAFVKHLASAIEQYQTDHNSTQVAEALSVVVAVNDEHPDMKIFAAVKQQGLLQDLYSVDFGEDAIAKANLAQIKAATQATAAEEIQDGIPAAAQAGSEEEVLQDLSSALTAHMDALDNDADVTTSTRAVVAALDKIAAVREKDPTILARIPTQAVADLKFVGLVERDENGPKPQQQYQKQIDLIREITEVHAQKTSAAAQADVSVPTPPTARQEAAAASATATSQPVEPTSEPKKEAPRGLFMRALRWLGRAVLSLLEDEPKKPAKTAPAAKPAVGAPAGVAADNPQVKKLEQAAKRFEDLVTQAQQGAPSIQQGVFRVDELTPDQKRQVRSPSEKLPDDLDSRGLAIAMKTIVKTLNPPVIPLDVQVALVDLDTSRPDYQEAVAVVLDGMPDENKRLLDLVTNSMRLAADPSLVGTTDMPVSNLASMLGQPIGEKYNDQYMKDNATKLGADALKKGMETNTIKLNKIAEAALNIGPLLARDKTKGSEASPSASPKVTRKQAQEVQQEAALREAAKAEAAKKVATH